ncbi:hypothetical protein GGE12_001347 [Rhizobium mongolense]|uniref:Amidase domain-containing protein n=1 Tax=Rhizobium mongolense TaxID=57676 RepID=A0A7W6WDJ4_9HYPH|nr:hypothetical protein [Rhizobium mongolense]
MPTIAACPDYAYLPEKDATVVRLLKEAAALVIGKTNLDQFATGLVGVRSPYPIPRNAIDPKLVPGGSSSGSAVATAQRHRQLCARHGYGRLGPYPCRAQQYRRPKTKCWRVFDEWRCSRLSHAGLRFGLRAHGR